MLLGSLHIALINMNKIRQVRQIESLCAFRDTIGIHCKYFSSDAEALQRLEEMRNMARLTSSLNMDVNCGSL